MKTDQNLDNWTQLESLTITNNFLYYMEFIKSASPHTLRAYKIDLLQFFQVKNPSNRTPYTPLLKDQKQKLQMLDKIILWFLSKILKSDWSKLSTPSRNRKMATLKSFFHWAYDQDLVTQDYSTRFTCPSIPQKIPHFLSVDEVLSVLNLFKNDLNHENIPQPQKILFLLLYGGALRISEACAIQWKDIEWKKKTIRLTGKGNKERLIPFPQMTMDFLKNLLRSKDHPIYILSKTESPLNPRVAYSWIQNLGVKASLQKPLNPHALRHSLATHLLTSGMNLRVLQDLLGHASLKATEKYTHLDIHRLAEVMQNTHSLSKFNK